MFNSLDLKDKWHLDRWGKFTASKIDILNGAGVRQMFSVGALSYIEEKAIENMTDIWEAPELENVKSLRYGKDLESMAAIKYMEHTRNYDMRYFGSESPVFLDYDKNSGGSPDGLMGEGETIHCGLELKCPKKSKVHLQYIGMKNQFDLLTLNSEYYGQIQFLLWITKAPVWHFCSFDERFTKFPHMQVKVLEVKPDIKYQERLLLRLRQAVIERDKLIEMYKNLAAA